MPPFWATSLGGKKVERGFAADSVEDTSHLPAAVEFHQMVRGG